jgi:sugar lactone lactonase YvrE
MIAQKMWFGILAAGLFTLSASAEIFGMAAAANSAVSFGNVNLNASVTETVTLSFSSETTLDKISVVSEGATSMDFLGVSGGNCTVGESYQLNSTCTVRVSFKPRYPGLRRGAVVLSNSEGNPIAAVFVYGNGEGPRSGFLPGTQSPVYFNSQTFPERIAVDANGDVYLINSLSNSNTVWKVTAAANGYTQTAIGSGLASPNGLAIDGAGNLYITDSDEFRVVKETPTARGYTQSVAVNLPASTYPSEPYGIAIDGSGNLYLTDVSNKRILKETLTAGSYTQSVIPSSGLNASYGIAVDGNGNIFVADTFNNRIVEEAFNNGSYTQSVVATGLSYPYGVAVDGTANLYIADSLNNRVLMQSTQGTGISSVIVQNELGNGLQYPYGISISGNGMVYIADSGNHRALRVNLAIPPALAFAATQQGATSSDSPQSVTVANLGNTELKFQAVSYPADFPQSQAGANDCGADASLGSGETCSLTIDFAPKTARSTGTSTTRSEDLKITTDTLNESGILQEISVTGTETYPSASAK